MTWFFGSFLPAWVAAALVMWLLEDFFSRSNR